MSDPSLVDILDRLSSGDSAGAWRDFVGRFSPTIMQVVRRHESRDDRVSECFLHVCAALSDDGFRRLRSFRRDGPASFRTWLMAVVANLCIDWRRRQDGRVRPLRAIARLGELEQLVFRYIFVRGMPRAQCLQTLQPQYPELTESRLADINARLFGLLTPEQRFQLSVRAAGTQSRGPVSVDDEMTAHESTNAPGPDAQAEEQQELAHLQSALARLPAPQRLLLRLRFEQGLTLAEVARLTGEADPFRAHRKVQAALAALADLLDG